MLSKLLRSIFVFLIAVSLISCSSPSENDQSQISPDKMYMGANAMAFVTGSIFNQPVDPSGKLFLSSWLDPDGSDFDQYIWDDFTLQSNETITGIQWYGGYDPVKNGMGGPVVDFTVAIFPSIAAGTEPAVANPPLVTYQTGGSAGETSIGQVNGIPMYEYTFDLPVSFAASAGVKYWVQIEAWQHGISPDWGLVAGSGGDNNHYVKGSGAGGDVRFWFAPGDAAFKLLGPTPDVPTDILLSNDAVDENQPADTVIGQLTATDLDPNATFTFSLACAVAGADDGSFNINGSDLRTSASFDYEAWNMFDICIRVTNQGGSFFDKNFTIFVNDLNEAPTAISLSNFAVDENQPVNTLVGELTADDPDAGATFTFGLTCTGPGVDDASFNINGINLQTSALFDFETQNTFDICIRVTDQGGLTLDENFALTVNDVNEMPTGITLSNAILSENQPINTVIGALTAADPDAGATFTFSLTCMFAGADDASFNISGSDLRTSSIFDFEAKSTYNICIRVTDQGGLSFDKNFVVTINNINENTAPTDLSLSNTAMDENQPVDTLVGGLSAVDPEPNSTFAFSLTCATAGADDGSFNILGSNLRTSATFDFETKSVYNICIRVTDQGGLSFDKNFVVTVNNINEAPSSLSLSNNTVDENQAVNTVVGMLTANDPDAGATFTFSLMCATPGADDGSFNILGTSLRTSAMFDFETKPAYTICIRVTDQGGLNFDRNFVIGVNDVDEITNTPGKVTGGGNIDLTNKKATFGFILQFSAGDASPSGNLTFMDHSTRMSLKASSFTLLYINGNHARITGYATVDGVSNVLFLLDVYDNGEPGNADVFTIQIPEMNNYSVSSSISGGNIRISTP